MSSFRCACFLWIPLCFQFCCYLAHSCHRGCLLAFVMLMLDCRWIRISARYNRDCIAEFEWCFIDGSKTRSGAEGSQKQECTWGLKISRLTKSRSHSRIQFSADGDIFARHRPSKLREKNWQFVLPYTFYHKWSNNTASRLEIKHYYSSAYK